MRLFEPSVLHLIATFDGGYGNSPPASCVLRVCQRKKKGEMKNSSCVIFFSFPGGNSDISQMANIPELPAKTGVYLVGKVF